VRVSEKLARTEVHLTLEFLLECLHGIIKVHAMVLLLYIFLTLEIAKRSSHEKSSIGLYATMAAKSGLILPKEY
jgi:hypothetical protein